MARLPLKERQGFREFFSRGLLEGGIFVAAQPCMREVDDALSPVRIVPVAFLLLGLLPSSWMISAPAAHQASHEKKTRTFPPLSIPDLIEE
jgi:hypothetical protein